MDRPGAVTQLQRVFTLLGEDLDRAVDFGKREPGQFALRTLYRTYFAFIEGVSFQLRQVSLATLKDTDLLSDAELALLREERFQLNHKGVPETRENFQSFLPNLLFSIRCYVKNHGGTYEPDIGVAAWESMRKAVAIRDRLTHPKSEEGLHVSEDDERHLIAAAGWWKKTMVEMFAACGEADKHWRAKFKESGNEV
jgi:hypothetical protein